MYKLRLVVKTMPKQNRCHKFDSDHIFVPEKKMIWAIFVDKFFVPIRVSLSGKK